MQIKLLSFYKWILIVAGLLVQGITLAAPPASPSSNKPVQTKPTPKPASKPVAVPKNSEQQRVRHQQQQVKAIQQRIIQSAPKGKDGKPIQRYVNGTPLTGNRSKQGSVHHSRVNIKYRDKVVSYDNGKSHGSIKGDHLHFRDRTRPPGKTFSRRGQAPTLVKNLSPEKQNKPFTKVVPANKQSTRTTRKFLQHKEKLLKKASKDARNQFRQKAKPKGGRK